MWIWLAPAFGVKDQPEGSGWFVYLPGSVAMTLILPGVLFLPLGVGFALRAILIVMIARTAI